MRIKVGCESSPTLSQLPIPAPFDRLVLPLRVGVKTRDTHRESVMPQQSGYEIRWSIMQDARIMLLETFHARQENENARAAFENRAPVLIDPPTIRDVKALAEEMYEFVQRK
jgi:hypothetical protein